MFNNNYAYATFFFKPLAQTQAFGQLASLKKILPQHAKKDAQLLKSKLRKRLASRFPNLLFKILATFQTREGCLLRFGFRIAANSTPKRVTSQITNVETSGVVPLSASDGAYAQGNKEVQCEIQIRRGNPPLSESDRGRILFGFERASRKAKGLKSRKASG